MTEDSKYFESLQEKECNSLEFCNELQFCVKSRLDQKIQLNQHCHCDIIIPTLVAEQQLIILMKIYVRN